MYGSSFSALLRRSFRRATTLLAAAAMVALAAPAIAGAVDYVAMGDSYASGTGTRTYFDSGCQRSVSAYPYLIKDSLGSSFTFAACSGAKTQDVLDGQLGSLTATTKYGSISIGGNDAGFSSVITKCAQPFVSCDSDITNAQNYINNTLPGRLDLVYNAIRSRAANAVVTAVGYPRLFNGSDCNALTFFSSDEMTKLNATADMLANVTRARARAHGMSFVDVRQAFVGHAVCDNTEWLNGLSNPTGESYHPNALGHSSGYAPMVRATLLAAPSPNAPVGGNGRIAFGTNRTGNNDVWVANADGTFPISLVDDPSSDVDPAWSPDGKKLAFASNRDGDYEIYTINGDGTGLTQLTANSSEDREPTWSPNGAYLAFRTDRTGNNEIFKVSAVGGSQTNITNNSASDFAPAWSPDGAEIAFQRFTSGSATGQGNEVLKENADGQGQLNLTNNAATINDGGPAWSPDGATIAFHSNRTGGLFTIFTMGATGGSATQRSTGAGNDTSPAWSPKGDLIAFTSTRDANDEIYTMTPTGGSQANRTANSAADNNPAWQEDSTPPVTTIGLQPSGAVNTARPTFQVASNELGSALQCSVDGAPYATCTSPFQTATLSDGPHSLSVRSVDPAGNVDPHPAVRTFTVDTVAPAVAVDCPATVLLDDAADALVTATDEGSGFPAGGDPSGAQPLVTSVPGTQTYSVTAIDVAGNATTKSCTYEVRYPDPGTPALTEGATPNAGDFTIGWTPSADASRPIRYVLDRKDAGGDWQEAAAGLAGASRAFTSGDLADEGTWRFRVKGIDDVNHTETGWSAESDPVKVDQTAPAAPAISADRAAEYAGDGGWFRDTVTLSTTDNGDPDLRDGSAGSGVDPASVAAPETLMASGSVQRTVQDLVGHASAQAQRGVQVDTEKPALGLECPSSVLLHATASVLVTASDTQSGLRDDPSGSVAVDTDTPGDTTITRTATDNVGHERTASCDVGVHYAYSGLLAPVNPDGSSVYKLNSTVPLRLRLDDAADRSVGTAHITVEMERFSGNVLGTDIETTVTATPTNGKDFTYDAGSGEYRYNLSTKPLSVGTWNVKLTMDDGTVRRTRISLR
jgi:dipeptidyl aminopeptidase/acylaminoacyl peptidase